MVAAEAGPVALAEMAFAVSFFDAPATTRTTPTRRDVPWAKLAAVLARHAERSDKDGTGWTPATYKPGTTRSNANAVAWSCFAADCDHWKGAECEALFTELDRRGLAHVVYSTFSHDPEHDDHCLRVVLPLAAPVPAADWSTTWQRVNAGLFGGRCDPQTKDAARMFYLPACKPGAPRIAAPHDGAPLVVDALPAVALPAPSATNGTVSRGEVPRLGYATLEFLAFGAPVGQQRTCALAAARAGLAAGKSEDEATALVWQGLQRSPLGDPNNPWTEGHARQLVHDLAQREPTPLARAPELAAPAVGKSGDSGGTVVAASEQGTGLPFCTAQEIATSTPDRPEWVIRPWAPRGGITEIDGKIKAAGKTTLLMYMARCVVYGEDCLGEPVQSGPVVYLTEQSRASVREALRRAGLLDCPDLHLLCWPEVRGLSWELVVGQTAAHALEIGAGLLIVDTLGQWSGTTGDSENSAGEAQRAMGPLQVAASKGLAVTVARHERKAGGEVGESGRGSSAYSGCVDTIVRLARPAGDAHAGANVRVLQSLSRYDEVPETLVVELTPSGYVPLGDTAAYAQAQARVKLLQALPLSQDTAKAADDLAEAVKVARTVAYEALKQLVDEGRAMKTGKGKRGSPFVYWATVPIHSSAIEIGIADESEGSEAATTSIHSSATRPLADELGGAEPNHSSASAISIADERICQVCGGSLGPDEQNWCAGCQADVTAQLAVTDR